MTNRVGVIKLDFPVGVCDTCDLQLSEYEISIFDIKESKKSMTSRMCDECYELFIVTCELLRGDVEENL